MFSHVRTPVRRAGAAHYVLLTVGSFATATVLIEYFLLRTILYYRRHFVQEAGHCPAGPAAGGVGSVSRRSPPPGDGRWRPPRLPR